MITFIKAIKVVAKEHGYLFAVRDTYKFLVLHSKKKIKRYFEYPTLRLVDSLCNKGYKSLRVEDGYLTTDYDNEESAYEGLFKRQIRYIGIKTFHILILLTPVGLWFGISLLNALIAAGGTYTGVFSLVVIWNLVERLSRKKNIKEKANV